MHTSLPLLLPPRCSRMGGETAEVMGEMLATRADMLTINITYNSLNADISRTHQRTTRASLFPAMGNLYPGGCELLARVDDEDGLRRALAKAFPEYAALWDAAPIDAVSASGGVTRGGGRGWGRPRPHRSRARAGWVCLVIGEWMD